MGLEILCLWLFGSNRRINDKPKKIGNFFDSQLLPRDICAGSNGSWNFFNSGGNVRKNKRCSRWKRNHSFFSSGNGSIKKLKNY